MWYILKTNPQQERKAADELRRAGIRVYLPKHTYERENRRTKAKRIIRRPLWVGYLLINFRGHETPPFGIARACQGVRDFIKWTVANGDQEPVPVPDKVVGTYMRRQRTGDYDGARAERLYREEQRQRFKPGTEVRIMDGPFALFPGVVDHTDNDVATILVAIFGRDTVIEIDSFTKRLEVIETLARQAEAA